MIKKYLKKMFYCVRDYYYSPVVVKFIKALQPVKPEYGELIRIGSKGDGGYVMLNSFHNVEAAYSMGIFDNVDWDFAMGEKGIPIYMYDHTIKELPKEHHNFYFKKIGICGKETQHDELKDIGTLLHENNHIKSKNLILKMDIEGYEWESFATMSEDEITKFSQIVCEFHKFSRSSLRDKNSNINRAMRKILKHMKCIHIHINNNGAIDNIYGHYLPAYIEISFVRKDLLGNYKLLNYVDTTLDGKNVQGKEDVDINKLWGKYWN